VGEPLPIADRRAVDLLGGSSRPESHAARRRQLRIFRRPHDPSFTPARDPPRGDRGRLRREAAERGCDRLAPSPRSRPRGDLCAGAARSRST
jgi:hypothetical protein